MCTIKSIAILLYERAWTEFCIVIQLMHARRIGLIGYFLTLLGKFTSKILL